MTFFDALTFIGGIAMFLFGMNYMGNALEKKAGGSLSSMLSKFTSNKYMGFLLGLVVTAVIQSSSATTVMVVGFVNSGIMALSDSIAIIMGANVGTTVTAWILSLAGVSGDNFFVQMLKPSSFTPILALVGVILYMFVKDSKKRDIGMILLGFCVLMFGMETATDAVSGLKDVPEFTRLFVMFENPILGLLVGMLLTAIIQSSSASVGILQALCITGQVSVAAAFPIILGQNIGTCITAIISSIGANKNARRAATVHLNFNLFGSIIMMTIFYIGNAIIGFDFVSKSATALDIAIIHTICNVVATAVFLPMSSLFEKISCLLIKDGEEHPKIFLDERLFVNPAAALLQSKEKAEEMATKSVLALSRSLGLLSSYDDKRAKEIKDMEEEIDEYEDIINSYLVNLSKKDLSDANNLELTTLIHVTGGFERISDHAVHLCVYAKQMNDGKLSFSKQAKNELSVTVSAVLEIIDMTVKSFCKNNLTIAGNIEPLEQVVDKLTAKAKSNHVKRMLNGECSFEMGLVYADVLSVLERVSDCCSEIAASMIEISRSSLGIHEYLRDFKSEDNIEFSKKYSAYKEKYFFQ